MSIRRRERGSGFTLIELLIVLGIIAVLAAILIPSLSKARDQARVVKCQANLRSAGQGVQAFANDHGGFGQIIEMADPPFWPRLDSARRRYVYESLGRGRGRPILWPAAYGPYWGEGKLRTDDVSIASDAWDGRLTTVGARRTISLMQCPSDRTPVGTVLIPRPGYWDRRLFDLSYSINLEVFGSGTEANDVGLHVWRDGGYNGLMLGGQLDRIEGPGKVAMFSDATPPPRDSSPQFPLLGLHRFMAGQADPWLARDGGAHLPVIRHGARGARNVVYFDGHAQYLRVVKWSVSGRVPARHSPNTRISPYRVTELRYDQRPAAGVRGR